MVQTRATAKSPKKSKSVKESPSAQKKKKENEERLEEKEEGSEEDDEDVLPGAEGGKAAEPTVRRIIPGNGTPPNDSAITMNLIEKLAALAEQQVDAAATQAQAQAERQYEATVAIRPDAAVVDVLTALKKCAEAAKNGTEANWERANKTIAVKFRDFCGMDVIGAVTEDALAQGASHKINFFKMVEAILTDWMGKRNVGEALQEAASHERIPNSANGTFLGHLRYVGRLIDLVEWAGSETEADLTAKERKSMVNDIVDTWPAMILTDMGSTSDDKALDMKVLTATYRALRPTARTAVETAWSQANMRAACVSSYAPRTRRSRSCSPKRKSRKGSRSRSRSPKRKSRKTSRSRSRSPGRVRRKKGRARSPNRDRNREHSKRGHAHEESKGHRVSPNKRPHDNNANGRGHVDPKKQRPNLQGQRCKRPACVSGFEKLGLPFHRGIECPLTLCNNCNMPGHKERECRNAAAPRPATLLSGNGRAPFQRR